jgi:hypothetical protein
MFLGYVDWTTDGRPFYVGKGKEGRVRLLERRNPKHTAMRERHGHVRTVEFASSIETLVLRWEQETIAALSTLSARGNIGCNMTAGGERAVEFSEDVRAKMRKAWKTRPPPTQEYREKMRAITKAQHAANPALRERMAAGARATKGRSKGPCQWSPERLAAHLARMAKRRGIPVPASRRAKISETLKGRMLSAETLTKRKETQSSPEWKASHSMSAKAAWSKRKERAMSEETKAKISETWAKKGRSR